MTATATNQPPAPVPSSEVSFALLTNDGDVTSPLFLVTVDVARHAARVVNGATGGATPLSSAAAESLAEAVADLPAWAVLLAMEPRRDDPRDAAGDALPPGMHA